MKINICLVLIALLGPFGSYAQVKILFDCTKAETAGNADWVIDADAHNIDWESNDQIGSGTASNPQRYPTPLQNTVTSTTAETYWEGALSHWGIDCVNYGYEVETLTPYDSITYGNASHAQDLMNYKVYVIDEPNIRFTQAEKDAILNFVKNGGGLFMISDHNDSDRNNDGWDSPNIWNDFLDGVSPPNPFGIKFDLDYFSPATTNVSTSATDSLTRGPYGQVTMLTYSGATIMHIYPDSNSSAAGDIWMQGVSQSSHDSIMFAHAHFGAGKVAAIADSSPEDDGTGNPACTLYSAYATADNGSDRNLLMNAIIWLAETSVPVTGDSLSIITTKDTTLCAGSPVTITATGATSYVWQPGNLTTASITVNPTASGLYIVTGTTNGVSKNDTVTVNVDQFSSTTPQITAGGPITFCGTGSVLLMAPSGSAYHWNTNATQQSITATTSGSYYVTVTDNNGCSAVSNTITVTADQFSSTTPQISAAGAISFCAGGSVTLNSPSESSYNWSNGSNLQSISVTVSGTYKVTVSDNNNCTAVSNSITVSADTFSQTHPAINASGPIQFCTGGSVMLTAPSGDTYLWSNNSTQQSITVSQTGVFYLTLTDGNNCKTQSDTVNVTAGSSLTGVQIAPNGVLTICAGSMQTVSAPAGYTYLWNTGSSQQSITINQAGSYYVNVTATGGCNGVSDMLTVSVDSFNQSPWQISLTGANTFCMGDSAILTSPVASSYIWSNSAVQQQITVYQTGTYQVTITDFNNCTASTSDVSITANPLPTVSLTISPDSVCENAGSLTLNAGSPPGGTYSGAGVSGSQFNPASAGMGSHLVTYTYTDNNQCTNTASEALYVNVCTGIGIIEGPAIIIYPNPSSGIFEFESNGSFTPDVVTLYNIAGQIAFETEVNFSTHQTITLNLNQLQAGIYMAAFSDGENILRKKLVKIEP